MVSEKLKDQCFCVEKRSGLSTIGFPPLRTNILGNLSYTTIYEQDGFQLTGGLRISVIIFANLKIDKHFLQNCWPLHKNNLAHDSRVQLSFIY